MRRRPTVVPFAPAFLGIMLLAVAAFDVGFARAASEKLALPYRCVTSGDRVSVVAGAIRGLDIVGSRSTVMVELCETARWRDRGGACLPVEVHRFDVLCGDRRVAWSSVAAAIATTSRLEVELAEVDSGRDGASVRNVACLLEPSSRPQPRGSTPPTDALALSCREGGRDGASRIPLPAGYAPIGESGWLEPVVALAPDPVRAQRWGMGADIAQSELADITPLDARRASLDRFMDTADEAMQAPADVAATRDPPGHWQQPTPNRAGIERLPPPATTGSIGPPASDRERFQSGLSFYNSDQADRYVVMMISMTLLAAGLAWTAANRPSRSRSRPLDGYQRLIAAEGATQFSFAAAMTSRNAGTPRSFRRTRPPATRLMSPQTANGIQTIAGAIAANQRRLAELKGGGPLIDVLAGELEALSDRLQAVEAASAESPEAAQRSGPLLRNLIRELERVRRIIDGAAISIGAGGQGVARMPATRAEAYELLGLNPEAPHGTLKKVADGLRMSWHPDHARDEADRAEREKRIKAINTAVDLISGKRSAA